MSVYCHMNDVSLYQNERLTNKLARWKPSI
jgi:hypothetical protein